MKPIKVAAASVNQTPLDWAGNRSRISQCISEAKRQKASLLCLPELAMSGYGCEDQFLARATATHAMESLQKLLPSTEGLILAVGLPVRFHNAVYNSVALVADGNILGFYAKQNLASDGLHYEARWFREWQCGATAEIQVNGQNIPMGDFVFDVGGVRIAFEICEDAWVPDRPGRRYAGLGVDIILNPSASHFAFGKQEVREQFVREGSRAFGAAYVYANLVGNEAGRIIYDGGPMIATQGHIVAHDERLSFKVARVITAIIDPEVNRLAQARTYSREVELSGHPSLKMSFAWGEENEPTPATRILHMPKEQEFTRAVALGLFDYLRKSHARGFVVSLSGGADSAAVACLVVIMHHLVKNELSANEQKISLPHFPDGLPDVRELLTCVYQATENSGQTTYHAAETLSRVLDATFLTWQVQPSVDFYRSLAEDATQRALDWEVDDLALQNIQARVRAPGVWMLANIKGALLLATSNRSEAAVGYATMDGDTCGGLSPIAGIDKAFLLHWLNWLEKQGASDMPPIPELSVITSQRPTAELRPPGQKQTDEQDLMPYPILDKIERLAIRDKKAPVEVYELLIPLFPGYGSATLRAYVTHFFRLWSRNQWKRERYAPSFHLDDENLDPKTWCRFPILSAGFEEELAKLQQIKTR